MNDLTHWLSELAALYQELAIEQDTYFADASNFCEPDPVDELHLDIENTRKLGCGIAKVLEQYEFANTR